MDLELDFLVRPADDQVIWRYMSVEKYLSLLTSGKLYFCRPDKFEDPWDSFLPSVDSVAYAVPLTAAQRDKMVTFFKQTRTVFVVSCWYAKPHESAAMWDLYSSRDSGVAIKTTVGHLKKILNDSGHDYNIGMVEYEDYESCTRKFDQNPLAAAFVKRSSFAHESELRLAYISKGVTLIEEGGQKYVYPPEFANLQVDIPSLLQEVYFSPLMEEWLVSSIKDISTKYGIDQGCFTQSKLYQQNLY